MRGVSFGRNLNDFCLSFSGRTHGWERILALELSNDQVAKRIVKIYEEVLSN
jgi:hypothetical protein